MTGGIGEGAKFARSAQAALKAGTPGFYVRRKSTRIVTRGPFTTEFEAARVLRRQYTDEPTSFEVFEEER
jgi:hypothetical protein